MFALEFETLNGPAMLIATVSKQVRCFGNPVKAFEIVRDLGLDGGHFSLTQWRPEERKLDRVLRPDKAVMLKAIHESAGLKRLLDERIQLANAPSAIWHEADDTFAEIEERNAR